MKIRQGFVSNSSSSSFLMIIPKEEHEAALGQLSLLSREILKEIGHSETKIFDRDVVVISYINGNYSTLEDFSPSDAAAKEYLDQERANNQGFDEDYAGDYVSDAVYSWTDEYSKLVNIIFSHCEDM